MDVLELVLGVSGPKISSRQCGASCGMSVTTVGRTGVVVTPFDTEAEAVVMQIDAED